MQEFNKYKLNFNVMTHINKHIQGIVMFLVSICFSSCNMMSVLTIEIPQNPPTEIPDEIQSLLLVNRVPVNQFINNNPDSLQKTFYKNDFIYDTIIRDLQSADTTIKVLGELIFESKRFDYVIPENRFLNTDSSLFAASQMEWSEVEALCSRFRTDAILSLDFFSTSVSATLSKESEFIPYTENFESLFIARIKINYSALFKIYDPKVKTIVTSQLLNDTLVWEDADRQLKALFDRFTTIKKALIETGIAAALNLSSKITPEWTPARRKYFSRGNSDLKKTDLLIKSGDWDRAIEEWNRIAESSSSKALRSMAEFNLALANELAGDVKQAVYWGTKSYETMYRPVTYNYLNLLKKRFVKTKDKRDDS